MSNSVCVSTGVVHPGIIATSCARCPIGNDFACGLHSMRSSGTRSRILRVVAISRSNSGSRMSERGMMCAGAGCAGAQLRELAVHGELGVGVGRLARCAVGAGELVAQDAHVLLPAVEQTLQRALRMARVRVR